jgi:tetratricopeptide (TPR) repeat protein
MRSFSTFVVVALCLAFATSGIAQEGKEAPAAEKPEPVEKFEVMLKTGQTAMLEVIETTPESITVKFHKKGVSGQTKLLAVNLDPHCFYEIRRALMEITPENHIKLAIYCASVGMFNRAKYQIELAKSIDPEIVEKIKAMPDVMEKIANYLLDAAKKAYDKGEKQLAHDIGTRILTKLPETKAAAKVREVIDQLEKEIDQQEADAEAAREKKIAEEKDEAAKKVAEGREKVLKPLRKMAETARKHNHAGLKESNHTKSRHHFEAAASEGKKLLDHIDKAMKKAAEDPKLMETLTAMEAEAKKNTVKAYINAGNVSLRREDYNNAEKYAEAALKVDPDSGAAQSFQNQIETAKVQDQDIDGWRDRRGYGGPRRGGRGGGRR